MIGLENIFFCIKVKKVRTHSSHSQVLAIKVFSCSLGEIAVVITSRFEDALNFLPKIAHSQSQWKTDF